MTRTEKRAIINRKDFLPESCEIDSKVLIELHRYAVNSEVDDIYGADVSIETIKKIRKDIISSMES